MASSQRIAQSLFRCEAIGSQGKHYSMDIWDYFEQEAKKNGLLVKCAWKHPRLSVKDFNSSWNTLTMHLLASWNDQLLTFMPNNAHKKKRLF